MATHTHTCSQCLTVGVAGTPVNTNCSNGKPRIFVRDGGAVPMRGHLPGIARSDSAVYGIDSDGGRPRARFTIINTRPSPPTQIEIYALIDPGAESDLVVPMATARELRLVPTGQVERSKGSANATSQKVMFEPVKLLATFSRGGDTEEERFAFLDASAFEVGFGDAVATDIDLDAGSESPKGLVSCVSKRRRIDGESSEGGGGGGGGGGGEREGGEEEGGRGRGRAGIITSVGLIAHRPPSAPLNQCVILGANALRKLDFHVNVSSRCLVIKEERIEEDD